MRKINFRNAKKINFLFPFAHPSPEREILSHSRKFIFSLLLSLFVILLFFACQKDDDSATLEMPEEMETRTALKIIVKSCNSVADPNCNELLCVSEANVRAYPTREDRNNGTNSIASKLTNAMGEATFFEPAMDSLFIQVNYMTLLQREDAAVPEGEGTELGFVFVL